MVSGGQIKAGFNRGRPRFDSTAMGLLINWFGSMDRQVAFATILNLCDSCCFGRSLSATSGEFWFFIPIGDGLLLLLSHVPNLASHFLEFG
jgi:hypothetical protein